MNWKEHFERLSDPSDFGAGWIEPYVADTFGIDAVITSKVTKFGIPVIGLAGIGWAVGGPPGGMLGAVAGFVIGGMLQ